jgi:protein-tyrosine phosphatase
MSIPFERSLEVEGTFNFRDLGHYSARDGLSTRPGVLFRSGAIHDLRPVGALGVRTIVDLRSRSDVERDAGPLGAVRQEDGVRRVVTPLIPPRVGELSGHEYLNDRFGPGISAGRYSGYIEIGSSNVRDVFQLFASADAFPAVVHCTAGKDRTGVIIALILDLLGVAHETIVADYALSNAAVPDLVAHLMGDAADPGALSESDMLRFGAPREAMQGFLAQLHREHGSSRSWLSSIGVEDTVFDTLEEVLLTPP